MTIVSFYLVVGFHFFIIFTNLISIPILLFTQSCYISIPISSLLINLMFNHTNCPITAIENKLRIKLGLRPIKGFVGSWILSPIRKIIRRWRIHNGKSSDDRWRAELSTNPSSVEPVR